MPIAHFSVANKIPMRIGAGYEFQRQRLALTVRPDVAGIVIAELVSFPLAKPPDKQSG